MSLYVNLVRLVVVGISLTALLPPRASAAIAQEPGPGASASDSPKSKQLAGQEVTAQFLAERGAQVEILGLRHWTPAMLRDSLAVHMPGASLASTRLVATLHDDLGFPEAVAWRQAGDSAVNVLVAVIEPQESARVSLRVLGADTTRSVAPWAPLVEIVRTQLGLLTEVVEAPIYARTVDLPPAVPIEVRADSLLVRQIWAALEVHQSAEDVATARRLLTSSPNVHDRLAAVAILSNFEQEDGAWHALVGAILDPDGRVRGLAARVLRAFTSQTPRRLDWRPAAEELHAILDGSELSLLPGILDVLVATAVDPDLAGPLLGGGGHAVLMFAGATQPQVRRPSYRFLRSVSGGRDHGGRPDEWRAWIAGLSQ